MPEMKTTKTDLVESPEWQAVDRLVERMVPRSVRHDDWWELNEAITELVMATEANAVKRHGQVILAAVSGELFQQMSETCQEWGQ